MDSHCGLWALLFSWPKSRKKIYPEINRVLLFFFFFCRHKNFVTCIYVSVCVAYNCVGNVNFVLD